MELSRDEQPRRSEGKFSVLPGLTLSTDREPDGNRAEALVRKHQTPALAMPDGSEDPFVEKVFLGNHESGGSPTVSEAHGASGSPQVIVGLVAGSERRREILAKRQTCLCK